MKNKQPKKSNNLPCPCKSGKTYADCCEPFHKGQLPETALLLMRSRYSAYALGLTNYIMDTTHPESPLYEHNKEKWSQEISEFSTKTEFRDLKILSFEERGLFATVTFFAGLIQDKKDVSHIEKSLFEKVSGKWLYTAPE